MVFNSLTVKFDMQTDTETALFFWGGEGEADTQSISVN